MFELSFSDLLGKTVLVGITYYTKTDDFIERKQFFGTVIEANDRQIRFRQKDGSIFGLPPDLSSTKRAPKGEFRLHSTGEIVIDPDFISTWEVTRDSKG